MNNKCKMCNKMVRGRSDKLYCSSRCKSNYHNKLQRSTAKVTAEIDKILHRNRNILIEIMGENKTKIMVEKLKLDQNKFNYSYFTGMHINKNNKEVYNVYDFSYLIFSNQEILLYRNKKLPF